MTTQDIMHKAELDNTDQYGRKPSSTDWTCVGAWCVIIGYLITVIVATVKYSLYGTVGVMIAGMGAMLMLTAFDHGNAWRAAGQLLGGLLVVCAGIVICGAGR